MNIKKENLINICPNYINGGITQFHVPKGKKIVLNEKGQPDLINENEQDINPENFTTLLIKRNKN